MHWYNPTKMLEEDIPTPASEAQAIRLLSWHPNSKEFIEEYQKQRRATADVVKALILTGETFYKEHRKKRLSE
jgi:hypothetical protein